MIISSVSAGGIGQKSTEVSNASRDESTDRSAATSADVLNPTQTAPQVPFTAKSVGEPTDEEKKQQEENLNKVNELKGLIDAKLASGAEDFKAAANVLTNSSSDSRIRAMALCTLTPDENIVGIVMQMNSIVAAVFLGASVQAAVKILTVLYENGKSKKAADLLGGMARFKFEAAAATALIEMKDDAVLAIAREMELWVMASILNAKDDCAKKVLGVLCLKKETQKIAGILPRIRHEIAVAMIVEIGCDTAVEIITEVKSEAIASMAFIVSCNNALKKEIFNALNSKGVDGKMDEKVQNILTAMSCIDSMEKLRSEEDDKTIAEGVAEIVLKNTAMMVLILNKYGDIAWKVLNALYEKGEIKQVVDILEEMSSTSAVKALEKMEDNAIAEIGKQMNSYVAAHILEESADLAVRALNALYGKGEATQVANILGKMSSTSAVKALEKMEDNAIAEIGKQMNSYVAAYILEESADLAIKALNALYGKGEATQVANILGKMSSTSAVKALEKMEDNAIAEIGKQMNSYVAAYILEESADLAIKALNALYGKGEAKQVANILERMSPTSAVKALEKMEDNAIAAIVMQMSFYKIKSILDENNQVAIKVLCALCLREGKEDENWRNQAKRAVDIFEKTYKREKILDDPSLVEYKDILLGITPIENDAVNSGAKRLENANPQTEHGENNEEIQSEIKSPPCTEDDTEIQSETDSILFIEKDTEIQSEIKSPPCTEDDTEIQSETDSILFIEKDTEIQSEIKSPPCTEKDTEIQSETDSMLSFENDEEIQPETNSALSGKSDEEVQLKEKNEQNSMPTKAEKSLLHSAWLRVITAVVGFGALTGIVAIVALEIAATVIPLIATLIALVLAAIAIECASFALKKRGSNPKGAAK